jgi:hypothetical protein
VKKGIVRNPIAAAAIVAVLVTAFFCTGGCGHRDREESIATVIKFINDHAKGNIQMSLQRPDGTLVQMVSEYSTVATTTETCKLHIHSVTNNYRVNYYEASPTLRRIHDCTIGLHELPDMSISVDTQSPAEAEAQKQDGGLNSENIQGPSRSHLNIFDSERVDCWSDDEWTGDTAGNQPSATKGGGRHLHGFRLIFATGSEAATAANDLRAAAATCQ